VLSNCNKTNDNVYARALWPARGKVFMSSVSSLITLTELCFPDITGKVIRGWGQVVFSPGAYVTGGLPMGLILWLDQRTVDFNGFLRCLVYGENPITVNVAQGITYHYSPVGDVLQIFLNGLELANGAPIPVQVLNDQVLFEVSVNRTTVLG
jgi:hypothetical protein